MVYNNKRSPQAQDRREQKRLERERANTITLNYSFHDLQKNPGEIVFIEDNIKTLKKLLTEEFGCVPQHAVDHSFGDVLNRFG